MSFKEAGYVLQQGDGDHVAFLGSLMTIKIGGDATRGQFTLLEQISPPSFGPPLHVHHQEDEAFYVLEGELEVVCGDHEFHVGQGGFVFLPREIAHAFRVGQGGARLLQITTPAGFEHFAHEVGERLDTAVLPPPSPPDVARLVAAAERHHVSIVGPPLGQH